MNLATWKGAAQHHLRQALKHTPLGRPRIFIVRDSKGRVWKGPYRQGWTRKPKEYYLFGSERFALHALNVAHETGEVERVV